MKEEILITDELRLRIIDLEYQNLSEKEFISEIERIYFEETGKILPTKVEVFHSNDAPSLSNDSSGYDGTALYFHSADSKIKELYIISQGSQDLVDWEYNIKAMLAGIEYTQAVRTDEFVKDSIVNFDIKRDSVHIIGLSHSLGSNNNTTSYLLFDTFDKVYGMNGAQINYYQLFQVDREFINKLEEIYPILITNQDSIYDLNPKELEKVAKEFYSEKADNIHQVISTEDPLYWVSGTRGFFTLGDVDYVDTNPLYKGLREQIDTVPDEVVQSLQQLAIDYTISSKEGGTNQVLKDMLGIDMDVLNNIDSIGSVVKTYTMDQKSISKIINSINEKLPQLLQNIYVITRNTDLIFGSLMEAGYITEVQKDEFISELNEIEKALIEIQILVRLLLVTRKQGHLGTVISVDLAVFIRFKKIIKNVKDNLIALNSKEFKDVIDTMVAGHSSQELLSNFNNSNKSYDGPDMILYSNNKSQKIHLNLSATIRLYNEGKQLLEEKEQTIKQLQKEFEYEIFNSFEDERGKVKEKIYDMEQNPSSARYKSLLQRHLYSSRNKTIKSINVYDVFYPLKNVDIKFLLDDLSTNVESGFEIIDNYLNAVKDLFSSEEKISRYFKVLGGD